jgi:hypothetical protein
MLSEHATNQGEVFAALREVYDGRWARRVGSEGGRTFAWAGKAGLIGAVTETIDRHLDAMGAMGERFILCRMPVLSEEDRLTQAAVAIGNTGTEPAFRKELADAVHTFLTPFLRQQQHKVPELHVEAGWLATLAEFATRCRSVVERETRERQVELVPQPEATPRFAKVLAQLDGGLHAIGVRDADIPRILTRVALDGLPKTRRNVIEQVATTRPGAELTAAEVGDRLGLPSSPALRALEDLAAHGVVLRHSVPKAPHRWAPSDWLRDRWDSLQLDAPDATEPSPK